MSKGTPYISSMLARLAGAGAGRLTSSRVPWRRATPCRRRRRSTVAVHTAIVVATVVVATARRLVARPPHTLLTYRFRGPVRLTKGGVSTPLV